MACCAGEQRTPRCQAWTRLHQTRYCLGNHKKCSLSQCSARSSVRACTLSVRACTKSVCTFLHGSQLLGQVVHIGAERGDRGRALLKVRDLRVDLELSREGAPRSLPPMPRQTTNLRPVQLHSQGILKRQRHWEGRKRKSQTRIRKKEIHQL